MLQIPPTPPAQVRLAGIYERYKEARIAAKEAGGGTLALLLKDPEMLEAARSFLLTDDGIRLRLYFGIWLPAPQDIAAEVKEAEGPRATSSEYLWIDSKGKWSSPTPISSAQELVGFLKGLSKVVSHPGDQRPSQEEMAKLRPDIQKPQAFLAFGDARSKDPAAGAREPYRSWLAATLAQHQNSDLGHWAAFRLLESGAVMRPGEINPAPIVMQDAVNTLSQVLGVNEAQESPFLFGWHALGRVQDIGQDAPYLATFRLQVEQTPWAFSAALYAFIAKHLAAEDRSWILRCWSYASSQPSATESAAEMNPVYWVAADWLLSWGTPKDWDAFLRATPSAAWTRPLSALMSKVQKVPAYWGREAESAPSRGVMRLESDSFWHDPEACALALGADAQDFKTQGVHFAAIASEPLFKPAYPSSAILGFQIYRGVTDVECLVGENGKVAALYPRPSYGLHLFAPDLLPWLARVTFTPASVGGKPVSSPFLYRWNFILTP